MPARSLMRYRCTLQRSQNAPDGGGGWTVGWTVLETNLPCWLWYRSGQEVVVADRVVRTQSQAMIVPKGTDVSEKDQVINVVDRRGRSVAAGPFDIQAVGARADHLELQLAEGSDD